MTTPSGTISLADVNVELSKSSTAYITLDDTNVRELAGVLSGLISLASLQGKAVKVYNEVVSGPSSAMVGQSITVSISGGKPNTSVSYSGSASGSFTLDANGNASASFYFSSAGSYSYTFSFAGTGHSRSYSVNVSNYNEVVSGPGSATTGDTVTVSISGGAPGSYVTYSGSASGSLYLDGNGYATSRVGFPNAGTFTYYFYFYTSGNSRTYQVYVSDPPPPPPSPPAPAPAPTPAPAPAPTYNEVVSGPSSATRGSTVTISISGGAPNSTGSYSGSASGSFTLDSSGSTTSQVPFPDPGTYSYSFYFNATGHTRSYSITIT